MKKKFLFFAVALMATAVCAQDANDPTVSASTVSFAYCASTKSKVVVGVDRLPATWEGKTYDKAGTYVEVIENVAGCDSIVSLTIMEKNGAIPAVFSVGDGANDKVFFAQGNLQFMAYNGGQYFPEEGCYKHQVNELDASGNYKEAAGIWRFAEHQYDYCGFTNTSDGNAQGNVTNGVNNSPSISNTGWIDLFNRGMSGYGTNYPWSTDKCYSYSTSLEGSNYDWGVYNAISNGGNKPNYWFVLSRAQMEYLINSSNADNVRKNKYGTGRITNTSSTCLYLYGTILLPDDWSGAPAGLTFTPGNQNEGVNSYTTAQWAQMEAQGAVFLPHPYARKESSFVTPVGWTTYGGYWVSDGFQYGPRRVYIAYDTKDSKKKGQMFTDSYLPNENSQEKTACAVRLVRWVSK